MIDPAFEVAELTTHPAYLAVDPKQWERVIGTYVALAGDPTMSDRIWLYRRVLAVWWVFRMLRYLYELPRGLDRRLADTPSAWQAELPDRYAHYLALAQRLYAR